MTKLSSLMTADKEFVAFVDSLRSALKSEAPLPIAVNGLSGGATYAFVAEGIRSVCGTPALILAGTDEECAGLCSALTDYGLRARLYKHRDFIFNNIGASHDTERERLSVLHALLSGDCDCVVATPAAAISCTMPAEYLLSHSLSLNVGDSISVEALCERLTALGYARNDTVEGAGQFSHRGGIVDFFSGEEALPVRVEFFGDEVDRMVFFDPITQRSTGACDKILLLPAAEVVLDSEARKRAAREAKRLAARCKEPEDAAKLNAEASALEGGLIADFRDKYIGIIYNSFETLLSYFEKIGKCSVFLLGTSACRDSAEARSKLLESEAQSLVKRGLAASGWAKYSQSVADYSAFLEHGAVTVHVNSFAGGINTPLSAIFGFRCRRTVSYGNNLAMLREDLDTLRRGMYRVLILCANRQGADSLISTLYDFNIPSSFKAPDSDFDIKSAPGGTVFVSIGDTEGFDLIMPKIAVISMAPEEGYRIMANKRRQRILKKTGGAGQRLMSYADLSVGDYVVHANYGIGLFEGIQTVTTLGVTRDYITIRYAGTDKLFVPCDRLEMIGKYIGERDSGGKVKLSKMGGGDWVRAKSRAKSAAKDIAKELINLYAERQRKPGFAFPADCDLEDQFAASFEYEETESQLQAIDEIKCDMMRPVPMNRLLCGDVGFGKTEVALRAAFKAIMGGKQVAILVPTTILALQHYQTASSRMRGYPVGVEMLSGFRTPKEQEKILRAVKRGEIDILIGTHKLLSKKIEFRDLGLLIIDEEQRFGVAQKEKLRQMAKNVDTLTLSATPIPRTLNMAMNGISDMSILDEAPGERRPVQTYVLEHDDGVINDAIKKELLRRGQVLYLYNKVEDIGLVAGRIMKAHPEARVAVAHGQMERDELEDIWQSLVRAEIDILVCTTIIETGVDLPGANTLIIENADRFGLSQLHQIRGRVGRSERQAYAYFTYRRGKVLTEIADKRLRAIREYTEFGAGFKVALRDLEIRGAGNLLGAQQHGYIESVGYDLYVKLLSEAVLEERGIEKEKRDNATVDIKVSANIPESYVRSASQRMEMYKKISLIREPRDLFDITDEFTDRFGDMPRVTEKLLDVALVKALAEEAGLSKVELRDGVLYFHGEVLDFDIWARVMPDFSGMMVRATSSSPLIFYKLRHGDDAVGIARSALEKYYIEKSKDREKDTRK